VDDGGDLQPGRDFIIALAIAVAADAAIFLAPGVEFPVLHTILNTGIALGTCAVSLLFLDLGMRTGAPLLRRMATIFAVVGVLEIMHVLAALEPASASDLINELHRHLRSGAWAPPAYLLPLGIGIAIFDVRTVYADTTSTVAAPLKTSFSARRAEQISIGS